MTAKTPALDFLRKVEVWQRDDTGTAAGLAVSLPSREMQALDQILAKAAKADAPSGQLEVRARNWLIGYREMNPPLTSGQLAELDEIIDRTAAYPKPEKRPARRRRVSRVTSAVSFPALAAILAIIAIVLGTRLLVTALSAPHPASPAAPVIFAPAPAPQPVPAGRTALQQFEADWGIPVTARDGAGNPQALVLLMNGLYYPSGWTVPATDPAWIPDPGGHISSVSIEGPRAVITDSDGNQWTVGTGQPFTLASDPGVVLGPARDGTILAMPAPHAIVIRHRIR